MDKFLKIGEVSKLCNISIKTLRFYEDEKLIKPVEVDRFTGYRHYDEKNVEEIFKIQFLKEMGFSLKEIRNFDENSFKEKKADLKKQIKALKEKVSLLSTFNKLKKGEKDMEIFVNDPQAIGKWSYVASSVSKEEYLKNDFYVDKDVFLKNLYFLPNGQGYWIFEAWTKGTIFHYSGDKYHYEILGDLMFVDVFAQGIKEVCLIFKKENSKKYSVEELKIKDDTNIKFESDPEAVGFWEAVDFIHYDEKATYVPRKNAQKDLHLKSIQLGPDGSCVLAGDNSKSLIAWSKSVIIDKGFGTVSNFEIKTFGNEKYLIMDWKSGDYVYSGTIYGCYVFKKAK